MSRETYELEQLYRSGASLQDCADAYGRSVSWVRKRLSDRGVVLRPRGGTAGQGLPPETARLRRVSVHAMVLAGATGPQMATVLGISEGAVQKHKRILRAKGLL